MPLFAKASSDRVNLEPLRHLGPATEDEFPSDGTPTQLPEPERSLLRSRAAKGSRLSRVAIWIRVLCGLFSAGISLAIIGLLARVLAVYDSTSHSKMVIRPGLVSNAWPSSHPSAMVPTYLLLGTAATVCVVHVLEVIWDCILLKNRREAAKSHPLKTALSLALLGLLIAALVVFKLHEGQDGIYGWSCAHKDLEVTLGRNEIGLGQVCNFINASWDLGVALASLEIVTFVVLVAGFKQAKEGRRRVQPFNLGRTGYREIDPTTDKGPQGYSE